MESGVYCFSFDLKVFSQCEAPVNGQTRYFIVGVIGIWLLLNDTEGQSPGRKRERDEG